MVKPAELHVASRSHPIVDAGGPIPPHVKGSAGTQTHGLPWRPIRWLAPVPGGADYRRDADRRRGGRRGPNGAECNDRDESGLLTPEHGHWQGMVANHLTSNTAGLRSLPTSFRVPRSGRAPRGSWLPMPA